MEGLIKGVEKKPYKILCYGPPGIGKSTFAASSEKPVFLNFENGLTRIDTTKTPFIESVASLKSWLNKIAESEFKTVCFDTLDALETLFIKDIIKEHPTCPKNKKQVHAIGDYGFGLGYELLLSKYNWLIVAIDHLVAKGKNVILIAHERVEEFKSPEGEPYNRYSPNIHRRGVNAVFGALDGVFFCDYEKHRKENPEKFGVTTHRIVGTGRRVIYTKDHPQYVCKSRFVELANVLEMGPDVFKKLI